MYKTRQQHDYSNHVTPPSSMNLQSSTAIYLGLSHLTAGAVALGLSSCLMHLHISLLSVLPIALIGAAICGSLCTLNLQYSLYRLEILLSRLAYDSLHSLDKKSKNAFLFIQHFPLFLLFLYVQQIEQRVQCYRTNARLTADVREQALQQVREAAALAERNRIARDLHDSIKQHIFGINASAAAARVYWQDANDSAAREAVREIERNAQEAQIEMQALLQQLRPAPLENTGLLEALRIQAQALEFRTGACVEVDLAALPEQDCLLPGTQEAVFRLIQEAFANIARHARAQKVWLALHNTGQTLHITVYDDGQGFDPARMRSGMGLSNMRERTRILQGSVEVSSKPGSGTTVVIIIPLIKALCSPSEEAHLRYEQERAEELARRGYRRCTNACFLSVAFGLIGIINLWATFMSLDVLIALLVALYGYTSGVHYRSRVASYTGQESQVTLELAQDHYRAGLSLLLPTNLGLWYLLRLLTPLRVNLSPWLIVSIAFCLMGLIQFSLWRDANVSKHTFGLFSLQKMSDELEKHQQAFNRSFMIFAIASITGMIVNRSFFKFPPVTSAQQNAWGLALILLLIGISHILNHQYILQWKQQVRQRTYDQSHAAKEG